MKRANSLSSNSGKEELRPLALLAILGYLTKMQRFRKDADVVRAERDRYREFVERMWLELDNAADAVGPVPDLVERNLRTWSREAREALDG